MPNNRVINYVKSSLRFSECMNPYISTVQPKIYNLILFLKIFPINIYMHEHLSALMMFYINFNYFCGVIIVIIHVTANCNMRFAYIAFRYFRKHNTSCLIFICMIISFVKKSAMFQHNLDF